MKHIWKKQLTATLLVLAMLVSLMPAAFAVEEHSAATGWSKDDNQHWHACTTEGCEQNGKHDLANHSYQNYTQTKAPTHLAKGEEVGTCVCGATNKREVEAVGTETHSYDTAWKNDSTHHWHECKYSDCTDKLQANSKAEHTWQTKSDNKQHWKECSVCKYATAKENHAEGTTINGVCDECNAEIITVTIVDGSSETKSVIKVGNHTGLTKSISGTFKGWTDNSNKQTWDGKMTVLTSSEVNTAIAAITHASGTYAVTYYAVYDKRTGDTITVEVDADDETYFDEDEFEDAFDEEKFDDEEELEYVTFKGVSLTGFTGEVYNDGTKITSASSLNNQKFYVSSEKNKSDYIEELYITADRLAEDKTIDFTYELHGDKGDVVTGTIKLIVNGNADPDISYEVEPGKTVELDAEDFWNFYDDTKASSDKKDLDYVQFTDLPVSSAGVLWYNYGEKDAKKVSSTTKYYYDASGSELDLDNITFVANKNFKNTEKIVFTASSGSKSYRGLLEFCSTKNAEGDILYKVAANSYVDFNEDDFNDYYQTEKNTSKDIKYVIFDNLPASSAGTMYVNYGTRSEEKMTSSKFVGTKFYYGDNGGKNDYDLADLTFETSKTFKTAVKINFTAYESGTKKAEGTLVIDPNGASYVSNIRYTTTTGTKVQINANDIARFFNKTYPYYDLQYVTFTGVPDVGSLYYNYYGVSKYGSTTAMQLTKNNCSSKLFYFSPATTANYALSELTYVPSGANYCTTIPFTAYSGNRAISGSILISVSTKAVSEVYTVTQKGTAVTFPASTVVNAVKTATGSTLASIQLLSTPAASVASVSVGSTAANTSTAYVSGSTMNQLKITPALGYTGSIELPYVALNSNGTAIASGVVSVGVVNALKSFSDVAATGWYYKYVTELADAGVINGYPNGSYKPNNTVTYGEALKLIMRAAGYSEQKATGKHFASGYLAKAQADGIVTSTSVDLNKAITRQQVAELAARAMKLSTSNLSTSRPFTDTTNVYVQALNAAGIVEGYFANGTSTFKPNNTLTRAEAATIVWRMQNYNK